MSRVLILAAAMTLLPAAAAAQTEPAPAPIGDGFQLNIGLVDRTFPLAGNLNLTTPVQVGYHFNRVSVLLGAYLLRVGTSDETTVPGEPRELFEGSATAVQLAPAVRYYLAEVRPSGFAPFLQAEFDVLFTATDTSREPDPTPSVSEDDDENPMAFGFAVGFGAEYLFSKNFGLTAEMTLRYLRASSTSGFGAGGESTIAIDALALGGSAGINLHF